MTFCKAIGQKHKIIPNKQKGVILVISLIVLVAMTLAAIAMVRSVDTTNIIAGNLAFQQSATNAADLGSEAATIWLEANNIGTTLWASNLAQGYSAVWTVDQGYSWDQIITSSGIMPVALALDANTGNTASYIIQRMCPVEGVAVNPYLPATGCAEPKVQPIIQKLPGPPPPAAPLQRYYRITTRVLGPRNTVSYTQTIVAL